MKYTSAQANKLLRKLQAEKEDLELAEQRTCTFVAANTEDEESLRPAYSFEETQSELARVNHQIRRVKHAINVFNATTVLPGFDMTIDEVLVCMPQLRQRLVRLYNMAVRLPKQRCSRMGNSNIIDYEYANYDIAAVKAEGEKIADEIRRIQTALDVLNNTVVMEMDV